MWSDSFPISPSEEMKPMHTHHSPVSPPFGLSCEAITSDPIKSCTATHLGPWSKYNTESGGWVLPFSTFFFFFLLQTEAPMCCCLLCISCQIRTDKAISPDPCNMISKLIEMEGDYPEIVMKWNNSKRATNLHLNRVLQLKWQIFWDEHLFIIYCVRVFCNNQR